MCSKQELISDFIEIGVVKLGEFVLKSGGLSPIYIDLRIVVSRPNVVKKMAELIWCEKTNKGLNCDLFCGVPYTALPIASVLSVEKNVPLVMKRKEQKKYGTKKMVEGIFKSGQNCIIVEDIVSSGSSVIETADCLRQEGLIVTDCIVVLDRNQGGKQNLAERGIALHSLLTLETIINVLCDMDKLSLEKKSSLKTYLTENSFIAIKSKVSDTIPFLERKDKTIQPVAKRLFSIIDAKESNLCVAVDTMNSKDLLHLADILGPYICMLKTHIDILNDFNHSVVANLSKLSEKHQFLIFEDKKFADIGNTVKYQYSQGLYKISDWADIVTAHCFPGEGIVDALKTATVADAKSRACLLIAQMSSKGALNSDEYVKKVVDIAEKNADFVIGFISQNRVSDNSGFVHMCPGIKLNGTTDSLGQQYKSPESAIANGADIIIVGRGITGAEDIIKTAEEYKIRAFKAYKNRISNV